jgi:DNA-binding HxlR family transcriptional regulator
VFGERWTLLLVREFLYGPKRYTDLLEALPGITTNLLAKRLAEMTEYGIVEQTDLPRPARGKVYRLTELGAKLEPVVMEIARFGGHFMGTLGPNDTANIAWGLLSMKRRYLGGQCFTVALHVAGPHPVGEPEAERHFELSFEPQKLTVEERLSDHAALALRGDTAAFRDWLFRGASSKALLRDGRLEASGSRRELVRFVKALALAA